MSHARHAAKMAAVPVQVERTTEIDAGTRVLQAVWSTLGNWLAVTLSSGEVQLWRASLGGAWSRLTSIVKTHDTQNQLTEAMVFS